MMQDIERICARRRRTRTAHWFPDIAGNGDPYGSAAGCLGELPRRELHLAVPQPAPDPEAAAVPARRRRRARRRCEVAAIHDERGYRRRAPGAGAAVRRRLARSGHPGGRCRPRRRPPAGAAPQRRRRRDAGGERARACCSTSPTSGATTCGCSRRTTPASTPPTTPRRAIRSGEGRSSAEIELERSSRHAFSPPGRRWPKAG